MAGAQDFSLFVSHPQDGIAAMELAVDGISCAGCMARIERELGQAPGMRRARVNFSNRRVSVEWEAGRLAPEAIIARLGALGYPAYPFRQAGRNTRETDALQDLLKRLAVAGFAAMNIMLLSVPVWSGGGMAPEQRDFFHWLSALIALPAAAYAGRPFFDSALRAIRARSVNMDVPITLGVVLALAMSVFETAHHGPHAYFDGAVMLVFFLLGGRVLDAVMRRKAFNLAENIAALKAETASRLVGGEIVTVPVAAIRPGDLVLVRPGERVPVDGLVEGGHAHVDRSIATGETLPAAIKPGDEVLSGMLNLDGTLRLRATAADETSFLDTVTRLVAAASTARAGRTRLADRAARFYAPLVHAAALATFLGWLAAGSAWQPALITAITVLIITCPCALGLAIPAVQVTASGALFRAGVLLNSPEALEHLGEIDTVVFDKTGTLTLPEAAPLDLEGADPALLALAGRLALASTHPNARALARATGARAPLGAVTEYPGEGIEAWHEGMRLRLGSPAFCGVPATGEATLAFSRDGVGRTFAIGQRLRPDAEAVVAALRAQGLAVLILSGDRQAAVDEIAARLGVTEAQGGLRPADKIARLAGLAREGRKVLMVGDGLNDAPALAAAHVSLSPVSAAHLSQAAADAVFLGESLRPVAAAVATGRKARRLMLQNLWAAALYNLVAVPVAVAGLATPLVAALAMSGSSLLVTLNALRARRAGREARP